MRDLLDALFLGTGLGSAQLVALFLSGAIVGFMMRGDRDD